MKAKKTLKKGTRAWQKGYRKKLPPVWARQGLPALFEKFIRLVKGGSEARGDLIHLDIGCGNGVKTVEFAKAGLKTLGLDTSAPALQQARSLIRQLGLGQTCRVLNSSGFKIPLAPNSVGSVSDVLCFTHFKKVGRQAYLQELKRTLVPGGYCLFLIFSLKDRHFHGHRVSRQYTFRFDPRNLLMRGFKHYEGMFNVHYDEAAIAETFADFEVLEILERPHPVHEMRYLWNVILRKPE